MAKRIAYLVSEYPAPSHTFIRREVAALRKLGIDVSTFSIRRRSENTRFSQEDLEAGKTTEYIQPSQIPLLLKAHIAALISRPVTYLQVFLKSLGHRPPGLKALVWSVFYFAEAIIFARRVQSLKIGHIHNHFANSGANVGLLASKYLRIPWSVTLHGAADWAYPAGYLLPKKISDASFVACASHFGRAQVLRVCSPSDWGKIFIVRCGVDKTKFPLHADRSSLSNPIKILNVGRLSPEKGQHGLLLAFSNLLKRGVNANLSIIGDGPEYERLREASIELGITDRFKMLGQKTEDEVLAELQTTDFFVMSSLIEGLPVVLMEALGMQVPVIAPCVAGIPELIRNGDSGFLYSPGAWNELTEKMFFAIDNSVLSRTMAKRGQEKIMREFDINLVVQPLANRFLENDGVQTSD